MHSQGPVKLLAAFGLAATLTGVGWMARPTATTAFTLTGGSLGTTQRDFRVFNNFTNPQANNNTVEQAEFPGTTGATLAIWKAHAEWGSLPRAGTGAGDPLQAILGSGDANFDNIFLGETSAVGGPNDNVHSELTGGSCGGATLAFVEGPISDGWRVRYCSGWTWHDGPGSVGSGVDLQGVATQMVGHTLGLGTSNVPNATMFPSISGTGTAWRSIAADDIAGLQAIYGVASAGKPSITSLGGSLASGFTLTVHGTNFAATGNEVWFTPAGGAANPIKVTGLASALGGTQLDVTVPGGVASGDLLVKIPGSGGTSLSNAWPFSPGTPLIFEGLPHVALGDAELEEIGGALFARNIGSSGNDGLTLQLGEVHGPMGTMILFGGGGITTASSSRRKTRPRGRINGLDNQVIGTFSMERQGANVELRGDFDGLGATSYDIHLTLDGEIVHSKLGVAPNDAFINIPSATAWSLGCQSYTCPPDAWISTWPGNLPIDLADGTGGHLANGSIIEAASGNIAPEYVTHIELLAADIDNDELSITTEQLLASGLPFAQVLGSAEMEGLPAGLMARNIGSSGNDGLTFSFAGWEDQVDDFQLDFEPIDIGGAAPVGAFIQGTSFGVFAGQPGQSLGSVRVTKAAQGVWDITADLTDVGSPLLLLQVLDGTTLVAQFDDHAGPIGTMSVPPDCTGKNGDVVVGGHGTKCLQIAATGSATFTIDGQQHVGDRLNILAETLSGTVDAQESFEVLAKDIGSITFTSAVGKPSPWSDLGCALAGVAGDPTLSGVGPLTADSANLIVLDQAAASALAILFVSFAANATPFKGGTLKTVPIALSVPLATSPAGDMTLPFTWVSGVPTGTELVFQMAMQDAAAVQGVSLSNALQAVTP